MSFSLSALLSQQAANLQTRKGLILLGLQNDFLSPDGKLPVSTRSGFLDRLKDLVHGFRDYGDVIWVRSEFEASRTINAPDENGDSVIAGEAARGLSSEPKDDAQDPSDPDEELFLTGGPNREPCCMPGTSGAEYASQIKELVDPQKDMQVVKTFYSAFGSTSLLLTLRSKLITELYVCGCNTNLSVFATAMDAARYGIKITLVEDCLGYRRRDRHDEAIRQLREIMEADVMTSIKVIDILKNPRTEEEDEYDQSDDGDEDDHDEVDDGGKTDITRTLPNTLVAADSQEDEEDDDDRKLEVRHAQPSSRSTATSSAHLQDAASKTHVAESIESAPSGLTHTRDDTSSDRKDDHSKCRDVEGHDTDVESYTLAANSDACGVEASMHQPSEGGAHLGSTESLRPSAISSDGRHDSPQISTNFSKPNDPEIVAPFSIDSIDHSAVQHHEAPTQPSERTAEQPNYAMSAPPHSATLGKPLFGADKELESAGSRIYYDLLPPELAASIFNTLILEVDWQRMRHQTGEAPRLVACQGTIDASDGSKPIYRHPSDQVLPLLPWTTIVEKVRAAAEELVGHTLNHALIQLYRGSTDYISEHSDKTLDIVPGSCIVNVSFGAQRTMRLRTKRIADKANASPISPPAQRTTYRVPLPHNSMLSLSLTTNAEYLHGINADKRPRCELSEAEMAFDSQRISLTFRHIGTFISADEKEIWGQGATGKTKDDARPVINGDAVESEKLVRAFGRENQASSIGWREVYGEGSDVLNLKEVRE